jgi:hypothetical protein
MPLAECRSIVFKTLRFPPITGQNSNAKPGVPLATSHSPQPLGWGVRHDLNVENHFNGLKVCAIHSLRCEELTGKPLKWFHILEGPRDPQPEGWGE